MIGIMYLKMILYKTNKIEEIIEYEIENIMYLGLCEDTLDIINVKTRYKN